MNIMFIYIYDIIYLLKNSLFYLIEMNLQHIP